MAEVGTYAEAKATIERLAAESFVSHELTHEGPQEWRCGRKGSVIYSFRILFRPGMIAVWGDLGEWILRHSDRDSLGWLRGAVSSPDYLLSKVQAGERLAFYADEAVAHLKAPETAEGWGTDRVAKISEEVEWADPLTQEKWLVACSDAGLDDPPLMEYPSSSALWLVELLRKFVSLEAELPCPGSDPMPLALAVVYQIETAMRPMDRIPRPAARPIVGTHRCTSIDKISYFLTVEFPVGVPRG